MQNRRYFIVCFFTSLLALTLFGCGKRGGRPTIPTELVEGTITLNGSPLAKAEILFIAQSSDGENATAMSDEQGLFRLTSLNGEPSKGALPGDYKVTVSKVETTQLTKAKKDPVLGEVWMEEKQVVPQAYQSAATTPLQVTIVKGKNSVPLDLQGK